MRTEIVIAANVSPAGFLPRTVNSLAFIVAWGIPVISPVVGFNEKPSGSGVLSCMKNSVMMFLYEGTPLVTSVPRINSILILEYDRRDGSLYSHLSVCTSPS